MAKHIQTIRHLLMANVLSVLESSLVFEHKRLTCFSNYHEILLHKESFITTSKLFNLSYLYLDLVIFIFGVTPRFLNCQIFRCLEIVIMEM